MKTCAIVGASGYTGRGLMLGLRLHHSAATAQRELYKAGMIVNCAAGSVLRFLPPFVITKEQIATGLQHLRTVLTRLPAAADADPSN